MGEAREREEEVKCSHNAAYGENGGMNRVLGALYCSCRVGRAVAYPVAVEPSRGDEAERVGLNLENELGKGA